MKNRIKIGMATLGLVALLAVPFQPIFADSGSATYAFILGEEPVEGPDVAMAPNGDTVALMGTGMISIHPKSASGSGEFVHKNAGGDVLAMGTWTATDLLSFKSYGCGFAGIASLCGGRAIIRVVIDPGEAGGPTFTGILQVDCLIGNPPAGAVEGVRLNVNGLINFNKEVSGETVFILE